MRYDVFISHFVKDREFAFKLYEDLKSHRISVRLDELNDSDIGSFANSMKKAIEESRFIYLIMSCYNSSGGTYVAESSDGKAKTWFRNL